MGVSRRGSSVVLRGVQTGTMPSKLKKNSRALIGLDIEGEWNVPLLFNAAEISGASMVFARTSPSEDPVGVNREPMQAFAEVLDQYDHVVACETGRSSRSVYASPAPRGRTAVVVGNELSGISKEALSRVHEIVSVPMHGRGMSSVNVGVAGAGVVWGGERDLARTGIRKSRLMRPDVDVLIQDPDDPNELGSLLRSVWAFGWRRVYLSDQQGVWFTKDRATVTAGRAAARRENNPLVIAPADQMDPRKYKTIIQCSQARSGTPLSRAAIRDKGAALIVLGESENHPCGDASMLKVHLDHRDSKARPRFRIAGSIMLSVISEMLCGGRRG